MNVACTLFKGIAEQIVDRILYVFFGGFRVTGRSQARVLFKISYIDTGLTSSRSALTTDC